MRTNPFVYSDYRQFVCKWDCIYLIILTNYKLTFIKKKNRVLPDFFALLVIKQKLIDVKHEIAKINHILM